MEKINNKKQSLEIMEGKNKSKKEKKAITKDEEKLNNLLLEIRQYDRKTDTIVFTIAIIGLIVIFVSLVIFMISLAKIDSLNMELSDIEVVSYSDDENNIVLSGSYKGNIQKRKVYFDLVVEVKNLNKKDISFARVIDNNSKEKLDITKLKSGNTYSHVLVDNVNEENKYDIEIKDIVFDE